MAFHCPLTLPPDPCPALRPTFSCPRTFSTCPQTPVCPHMLISRQCLFQPLLLSTGTWHTLTFLRLYPLVHRTRPPVHRPSLVHTPLPVNRPTLTFLRHGPLLLPSGLFLSTDPLLLFPDPLFMSTDTLLMSADPACCPQTRPAVRRLILPADRSFCLRTPFSVYIPLLLSAADKRDDRVFCIQEYSAQNEVF